MAENLLQVNAVPCPFWWAHTGYIYTKVKLSNTVLNKCKFNRNVADFVFIVQQIIALQGFNMASESHKDQVVLLLRAATAV